MLTSLTASIAAAQTPKVTITGGVDDLRINYTWQVTNHHTSRIIYVEFPHFMAETFTPPKGWSWDESTNMPKANVSPKPGLCIGRVKSTIGGIAPSMTATFAMRVQTPTVKRRPGNVLVRFADGTEVTVTGVELPHRESKFEKYSTPIGIAALGILWLIVRTIRKRKPTNT